MIARSFIPYLIGYFGLGVIVVPILLLRRQTWVHRADRLARQSDIVLPLWIEDDVIRFLRYEFLYSQLVTALILPPMNLVTGFLVAPQNRAHWLPWFLIGLPLYWTVVSFLISLGPRWKASTRYRVTHLGRMSVRHAFTPSEFAAVIIGAVLSVALTAWALRHAAAPATWWVACAAAFGVAFAVWLRAAESVMNRPSSASDEIELGWDDLLRFRQVRVLTIGATWGPAVVVYLIDLLTGFTSSANGHSSWLPILLPVVALVLLTRLFRQGRNRWRRAWLDPGGLG